MDDVKKGTQLLEVYALEIQMYTEQKNSKKLKTLYEQSLHIKSAIPHPLIMGVIRGEEEEETGEREGRRKRRGGGERGKRRGEWKTGKRKGGKMGKTKGRGERERKNGRGGGGGGGERWGKRGRGACVCTCTCKGERREVNNLLPPPSREAERGMRNQERGEKGRGTMQGGKRGKRSGTTFYLVDQTLFSTRYYWKVREGLA